MPSISRVRSLWVVSAGVLALGLGAASARGASSVYVTDYNAAKVSQFDVGSSGLLSPKLPATVGAGSGAGGIAVTPDGRNAYVGNAQGNSISQFDVAPGGTLIPKTPATVVTPTGGAVAVSPDGHSLYAVHFHGSLVGQFDIEADGRLTPKTPPTVSMSSVPFGVAVSPDGRSVYVPADGSTVAQFDVGAGGRLTAKVPANVPNPAGAAGPIAVTPDGRSAYVRGSTGAVSQFDIGADGGLTPKVPPTVTTAGSNPQGVAVSPDGRSVYVADAVDSGTVAQFDIGAEGALTPKTPPTFPVAKRPGWVAVSPSSRSVYVTNGGSLVVAQLDAAANGTLSPKSPEFVATDDYPNAVVVLPDQGPTASFVVTGAGRGATATLDASASSDPDGTIARYDWDFGDGSTAPDGGPTPTHVFGGGLSTVRLTVTDDQGCSTAFVFTGQTASCNAGAQATTTRVVAVDLDPGGIVILPPEVPRPPDFPVPGPGFEAPTLRSFEVTNAVFAPVLAKASRRARRGTTFRYVLSRPASVRIKLERGLAGKRSGKLCVRPTRSNRNARRCTRYFDAGTLTQAGRARKNGLPFAGRIAGKPLSEGDYRATATATANRLSSKPATLTFRVVDIEST